MLKTLRRYSTSESEKGMKGEDMNDVSFLSGEEQLNNNGSPVEAVSYQYFMLQRRMVKVKILQL